MAQRIAPIQLRLTWYARWLLIVAAHLAYAGLRVPYPWVVAVTNRSWSMRIGEREWRRIKINNRGEVIG